MLNQNKYVTLNKQSQLGEVGAFIIY